MYRLIALLVFFQTTLLFAQDATMRVVHCTAIAQEIEIYNFYVDDDNNKWAGTSNGLYQIHSADNASKVPLTDELWSLLQQPGGNQHLIFSYDDLFTTVDSIVDKVQLTEENKVSAAYYDKDFQELWIGTTQKGIYRFSTNGGQNLTFLSHWDTDNSKLKSNQINTIFIDQYNKQWIGTGSGVLVGSKEKWRLYEKGSNIQAVTSMGPDIWIMSEDVLYMADARNRWIPGDFDMTLANGGIKSIRYDSDGRLWSASDIITRYNVVDDKVERFGRAEGFSSREVTYITVDKDNALWVGTADKGLFLIEKESAMTVSCEVTKTLSCEGNQKDGALKVKIIGGLPPYAYKWDNGLKGDAPQNLGPGLYTVTVTDSEDRQKVVSARVEDVDLSIEALAKQASTSENLSDGVAVVRSEGGRPDYAFTWDNGEKGERAVALKAGKHQVTVVDANGCQAVASVEITAQKAPEVEPLELVIKQNGQNRCPGDKNVSLAATVKGGMVPYQYKWNDSSLSGQNISGLEANEYSLTITDALGNTTEKQVAITAPAPIKITAYETQPVSKQIIRDGRAVVKVSGGSAPYTYAWDNGEDRNQAIKLGVGNHTITIIDNNNCQSTAKVEVTIRQIPELDIRSLASGQIIRLEKLYFDADSADIKPASIPMLQELSRFLRANPGIVIEVGGHTNDIPEEAYCDRLSTARAKSVADFLSRKGIDINRVTYKGYGKRKPIANNKTAVGRKRNQRVEVKIVSVDKNG